MYQILGNCVSHRHQISLSNNLLYTSGQKAILYNIVSDQQLHFIHGSQQINAVLLSKDGTQIYTGELSFKNPSINIYNIGQEKQIYPSQRLIGHKFGIKILLESPIKPFLLSVGTESDKSLFLWDLIELKSIAINKLTNVVNQIKFNDDGTLLVCVGQTLIRLFQFRADGNPFLKDGTMISEDLVLNKQFCKKNFIDCFLNDEIFAATEDGLFCVISIYAKSISQWIQLDLPKIYTVAFSGELFFFGGQMQKVKVCDQNLNHICYLQTEDGKITENQQQKWENKFVDYDCIAMEANNNHLITVFRNKTIIIWDVNEIDQNQALKQLYSHQNYINDLLLLIPQSTEQTSFFVTSSNTELAFWHTKSDLENLKKFKNISNLSNLIDLQLEQSYNQLRNLCLSKNGQYLAVGDTYGCLRVFSMATFKICYHTQNHTLKITCLIFWEYLDSFVSGSDDKSIIVYNKVNYKTLYLLQHHSQPVSHLFSYKNRIVSYSKDKKLNFYKFQENNFILNNSILLYVSTIDQAASNLFFHHEGKIVVMEIASATVVACFALENCLRLQSLKLTDHIFISVISVNQLQIFEYLEPQFNLKETIEIENVQMIQIVNQKDLIIFCKDNSIILWQLKQNLVCDTLYIYEVNDQNKQWLHDNFWQTTQLEQDEQIDIITFDSDKEEEQTTTEIEGKQTPRLELLAFTLGEQHAQEIKNQFSEIQNHIVEELNQKGKKKLKPIIEEDPDLLFNSFYEEQKSMQEFHKKQNSKIQLKEKIKKSINKQVIEKAEQKVELETNKSIALPLQSQSISSKTQQKNLPFPKLKPLQLESSISSSIQKNNCTSSRSQRENKQSSQLELYNQNSIFLNQSYKQDSIVDEIESQDQLYQSQQINLAKCHIKLMMIQLNELIEDLNKIHPEPRKSILQEIDKDLNRLDQDITEIRQVDSESICDEQDNIKKMVSECSKEMFENYAKNIINQMRNQ